VLTKNTFFGMIFLCINLVTVISTNNNHKLTDINLIFANLKGVPYFNGNDGFDLPMVWFIINLFIIFNLANYFYDDLKNNGKYILTRVKKVKYFYFAKVFWSIYNVLIYYILVFVIMITVSKIFLYQSNKWVLIEGIKMNKDELVIKLFLLYFTTSTALVLLQNAISLILRPVYSYLVILLVIAISIFTVCNLLPGQQSLILRHVPFDNIHGLAVKESLLYNCLLSIFSIIAGYIIISKKDII
jgi:hypothetical protein